MLAAQAARAQSCSDGSPVAPPTPAPAQSSLSDTTIGAGTVYTPSNNGTPGCVGISDFDSDNSGEAGGPGGAAGALTVNLNNVQVIGATVDESPVRAIGVLFEANGGPGGPGGSGGNAAFTTTVAGPGGAGGAGGPLSLNFSGSVDMHSLPAPGFGLYVSAVGGDGAPGGTVGGGGGGGGTLGGAGGAAGGGGAITATINGDFLVSAAAVNIDASGGGGGSGGPNIVSYLVKDIEGGAGGAGGAGGSASLDYVSGTVNGRTAGLVALAQGGMGNDGGAVNKVSDGLPGGSIGGSGGAGGGGGTSSVTLEAGATVSIDRSDLTPLSVVPFQSAVVAAANGGNGGAGQPSVATGSATAGSGGAGGTAGQASATILGNIAFGGIFGETVGYGVQVLANGGQGGAGGNATAIAGTGGGGGLAGAGGTASLTLGSATQAGVVTSNAYNANAALVQSVGGGGGGGGSGYFNVTGGTGAAGGNGGAANANLINGQLIANASASSALIIQSIGGGGGVGGDETGIDIGVQVAIGGNGGLGGNGGPVNLDIGTNAVVASLSPIGDFGVLAQSIGGSGGAGGSASSTGVAILSLTVGGDAGMGAPSGNVLIHNDGIVTTYGSFGAGIQAQSIGGGGGDGGAGVASVISGFPTVAVALGGRGGGGGVGHDVTIYNTDNGQITTYGSDAYGIVAQSIGGGGGTGGLAASRAVSLVADPDIPAVSVAFALGGKGGIGNNAGNAEISNTGLVSTAGEGAVAIFSQSVGGGGGAGGDSTALAYSGGKNDEGIAVSAAVSIGGGGAGGGDGALATIANSGLVITLGTDAAGMVAQSVGGGGGRGGAGDSSATANDPEEGFTVGVNLAVGGSGGIGGKGGGVILINSGSVITGGDGADGFFAQSVGGGGGSAGGGVANAGGNQLTLAVAVGGSGGAGGDGGGVTAQNSGAIVTRGVDAMGILAQSVGGGGGEAGKGGATSGGVDNVAKSTVLYNTIAGGLNVGAGVTQVVDGVFKFGSYLEMTKTVDELTEVLGISKPTDNTAGVVGNLDLSLAVGGSGGAAGNGGEVDLTNSGGILTTGAQSDAIYAQSVGGGGGKGGEATSTGQSYDDTRNQISIGVAGGGGNAGNGGTVKVVNAASSEITTRGVLAFGILGQSIGGGGGTGAQGQAINGSLRSLAIAFNGFDGAQGTGGLVTIENDGSIVTQGKNGIGIFGQSIGGGGGIVETMTSDMTFNPDDLINNPQGRAGDIQGFSATFGGGTNSQGDGGQVQITNAGSISTMLRDAHGILAESIGGGGGATIGGQLIAGLQGGALPANTNNGNGGAVTVNLNSGSSIATQGDGAYGVLAHSIGGGGGLSGDLSNVTSASTTLSGGVILPGTGNGGNVTVNLTGAKITTSGTFAPGVLAQSVGGGGGILAQNGQLQVGASPTGNGRGGDLVSVNLVNSTINTTGMESPAIVVQNSYGLTPNGSSVVNIDANSVVTGGGRTPEPDPGFMYGAIVMLNNKGNWINNSGVITGVGTPVGGGGTYPSVAINSAGETQINNSGTITGTILTNGLSNLLNSASGLLHSREIALYGGQLSNAGTLMVDDFGVAIVGSLVNTGTIEYTRLYGGPSPGQLYVEGNVNLAGSIFISKAERISVGTSSFTAIASSGTITGLPSVSSDSAVLRFKPQLVGSSELVINVTPDFAAGQTGLSASRSSLATYLDAAYAKGDQGLATGLQTLIANATPASALANLNALSADGVISIASVRYEASQSFTRAIYGCPTFGEGTQRQEHDCAWFRIDGVWSEHDPEGGFSGYRWQAVTLKGGGQREIAPNLFLGGSLGYEGGVLEDKDNLTRVRSDSGLAAVALLYQHGPWTLISAADAGLGWFDSKRLIPIADNGEARGDSAAWNIGGHLRAAYRFAGPRLYLEPSLAVDLTYVSLGSFSEHGSTPFNLALDHAGNVVVSGTPEVRIGTRVGVGGGASLDIYAGGGASFLSGNTFDARARFVLASPDNGSFTTAIQNDNVVGRLTAGVQLFSAKRWDLQLQYEGRLSANEAEHGVQGRLVYRF